jgi:RNA-splicing ligase RtcB
MRIVQRFAVLNRQAMTEVILNGMELAETDRFTTIHNYIDTEAMILRKGSVSAKAGEHLLIPINMRDGSLLCVGKGNADWNFSAPHGAGRLMSRTKAFNTLSMDEFRAEMQVVFSTSIHRNTLDESPMAYKSMDEILAHIQPTVEVIERIRTVYNFKAGE